MKFVWVLYNKVLYGLPLWININSKCIWCIDEMNSEQYIEMFELNLAYSRKNLLWRVCCWNNYIWQSAPMCTSIDYTEPSSLCECCCYNIYSWLDQSQTKLLRWRPKRQISNRYRSLLYNKYIRTLNQL